MKTELIIAPPAAGKTTACIQRIQAVQRQHPLAQVWVLVPDRQKGAYFRTRLAAAGGGMGITIGTFRDLYRDILERAGIYIPVISQALGHRLIQETVRELHAAGELTHYSAIIEKPGFLIALQDAFAELRGAVVRPQRFLEYTRNTTPARYELAILYAHFLSRLNALNWIDQEGQSWLAIDTMESDPGAAAHLRLVVADGFTSFTGARMQFLKLLGEQSGELLITLPGEIGSSRPVHRRSLAVIETLQADLSPEVREIDADPHLPATILHMEQHALDPGDFEKRDTQKPILLEVGSQYEEAREALRWVKELHIRQHIPFSDCAIFTSNLDTYQPLLRLAANEFGMKVHFTHPDRLAESPAVLAIIALLSLPLEEYATRALFNVLHSPYFDFDLDAKELENLEKVSQQAIIVMGREQWDAAWEMLERSSARVAEQLDDERQRKDLTAGIDLQALRSRFEKFWELYSGIENARSLADWVEWLENLLAKLQYYDRISSERDREACTSLGDALKALVISESVVGMRNVDYAQFLADLQGALNGARVEEPRASRQNALLVGRMVEARASRFKAVALLGFSEGLFPQVENPDPFLDEALRKDLGLEPRLQREQGSIFYQAFTRADVHLLLTRPYLSEDGEPWEASPYWLSVQNLFAENAILKVQPAMIRAQADAASAQELLFWAVQQQGLQYPQDEELSARWQTLTKAHAILDSRRAKNPRGIYEGNVAQVTNQLMDNYSAAYEWSASRLEEYGSCPHRFFINSILKLAAKITPQPGLDGAQIGSIYHRILELVYDRAIKDQVMPLDVLDEVAARVFKDAPKEFSFRPSPLWEVEKVQNLEKLRQTLQALEDERMEWKPIGLERKFGIKGTPLLELELGEEIIHLHGVIDRVDRNARGEIRVVDYKTGSTHLEKSDLKSGLRLQLPIYALAAQNALHLGQVVDGFYWKINDARASAFKLSDFKSEDFEGPEAAYSVAIDHIRRYVSGIRSGEFPSKAPKGGCPEYCPATQWCWRYQAGFRYD
jgi:ATP-dependent helicase/nuclease subunit B